MAENGSYVVSNAFGVHIVKPGEEASRKDSGIVTDYGELGRRRVMPEQAVSGQGGQDADKGAGGVNASIRERFAAVGEIITQAARVKLDYAAYLAGLEKDKALIGLENMATLKKEAEKYTADQNSALHEQFKARVGELRAVLDKAHISFDLADPSLANALKLVELAGQGLGAENLQTIRTQFANNQPALRALQSVYRQRGIYDGELDKQIYNVDATFFNIVQTGEKAITGDGSIDDLASAIGRVATLEGVDPSEGADSGGEG